MQNLPPDARFCPDCRACLGGLHNRSAVRFSGATPRWKEGELTLETERQMARVGRARQRFGLKHRTVACGFARGRGGRGAGVSVKQDSGKNVFADGTEDFFALSWRLPYLSVWRPEPASRGRSLWDQHLPQFHNRDSTAKRSALADPPASRKASVRQFAG